MSDIIRLLYADDNPQDVDMTRAHFEREAPDFSLEIVESGTACLMRLAEQPFDMLLLDNRLPDMDGIDVLGKLRADGRTLPVVFVTGVGDEETVAKALRAGTADYVSKSDGIYLISLPDMLRKLVARQWGHSQNSDGEQHIQKILYIEPNPMDVELTTHHFAIAAPHLHLHTVNASRDALALLTEGHDFDLVLTDLRVPDMDALELIRETQHRGIDLPFVVITGRGDEATAVAILRLGAYDYIAKRKNYLVQLPHAIDHALHRFNLDQTTRRLNEELVTLNASLGKKVEARTVEIQATKNKLQATLDAIPDLLFEVDLDGRYYDYHSPRADLLVSPAEVIMGKWVTEVMPKAAAEIILSALREANETGRSIGKQFELPLAKGNCWFELSASRKVAEHGQAPRFIVLSRDITSRKMDEAKIMQLSQLYAGLSQCNQAIVRCANEDVLFRQICNDVVTFGGIKMAWIGMVLQQTMRVDCVASFGAGTDYLEGIQITVDDGDPYGRGPVGISIRENKPIWCQDFLNDPATKPWHGRAALVGWGAITSLPLYRNGSAIGAFVLYANKINFFDEATRNLLVEMANDISFALDNFDHIAESERANEALQLSEQHFRAYFDRAMLGMASTSPNMDWLEVNEALCEMLGYTREELMATTWADLTHPEDLSANLIQFNRILSGEIDEYSIENRYVRKDGSIVHARQSPRAVRKADGSLDYFVVWIEDITQRKQDEQHIQQLAHFDLLTGLPNRALFADRISHAINMAYRSNMNLAVMFLDLDHFKNVNDNLGHRIGDVLLVQIAKRLTFAMREEDTVSRLGGDEFILLLSVSDADGAAHVAEKLLETVVQPCRIEQHELVVTPSIGIAMYPNDGKDFETLSQCADVAMYRAKHDGRNNYKFFTVEMQTHSARTLQLESALRHALVRDELSLHYQPKISLQDGRIIGAEALLRWRHPSLGMVSPAEFIPIAESSGQILQIGEWVLRSAVQQMKSWMDDGMAPMIIAVNLSAVQFRHPNLPELVTQILGLMKLPAQYLELELIEGVAMHDPLGAITMMDNLHKRGIRMSIDDFGTGYSSLSYLKRFKVYKLKIDQSFVRDITNDPEDGAIVKAIIGLADSLGLQTIAEGVETEGQLALLHEQGCNEVQGYYFSKPLPTDEFETFILAKRQT